MAETESTKLTIDQLDRLFSDGKSCDKDLFSEQRSNVLLASGDHFSRKHGSQFTRIRESKSLTQEQKLRITKNHTHVIVRSYINNITSLSPGVMPVPVDEKDLRHQKTAELNKAVWEFAKKKHGLKARISSWAKNFVEIGEVFVKISFDPNAGEFVGYEQEVDDDGMPMVDEMGMPIPSDRASFAGDVLFKTLVPGNVIRAAEAKTIEESRFLCVEEMVAVEDLKKMVGNDEDKLKHITESEDDTFFVFDNSRSDYSSTRGQAVVREYYFRPSIEFPHGYFYITCGRGILFEGELPFGIFPIVYTGFDEIITTPRSRSIIKQLRPIQSEINRAASSMASAQVSLGDDKVILQNGSKVTNGPQLPGIRTLFVTGQAPTVMPGRSGEQFMGYLTASIAELYQIAGIQQDSELKPGTDPWQQLYASMKDKKKFSLYAEKFERFLAKVCEVYLELAKEYFDENMLIPAIGRAEHINIPEFKTQDPLFTRISIEPISDDINSMMGKTLQLNHVLQYAGNQLKPSDVGKIMRELPFANVEAAFDDLTIDEDTATNIILAIDRGETVQPMPSDNAEYILRRIAGRVKKADFRMLPPQTQQTYMILQGQYQQVLADQAAKIKQAESEFIPASGPLVKVDFQIKDPTNPARTVRAVVPSEALQWLITQLGVQGSAQEILQQQPQYQQAQIAERSVAQGMPPRQLTPGPQAQGPNLMGPQQFQAINNPSNVRAFPGVNTGGPR